MHTHIHQLIYSVSQRIPDHMKTNICMHAYTHIHIHQLILFRYAGLGVNLFITLCLLSVIKKVISLSVFPRVSSRFPPYTVIVHAGKRIFTPNHAYSMYTRPLRAHKNIHTHTSLHMHTYTRICIHTLTQSRYSADESTGKIRIHTKTELSMHACT